MEYIGSIIKYARERAGKLRYSVDANGVTTSGVSQELVCRFGTDAQTHLTSAIIKLRPYVFYREIVSSVVSGQEAYPIAPATERIFNDSQFLSVFYSTTGDLSNYRKIFPKTTIERDTSSGDPYFYIVQDNSILLDPIPNNSSGKLRTSYYKGFDSLRIRSGQISGTPSGTTITLSATGVLDYAFTADDAEYICVSDRYGNPLLYNAPIASYNASTHVITLTANVANYLVAGQILANLANAYVTVGQWTTTHSKLPIECERYIRTYIQKRLLAKDSSTDIIEEDVELKMIEGDIILGFAQTTPGVYDIPILDNSIY